MQFSPDQLRTLDSGQPPPLTVEGRKCVLLSGAYYDSLREASDDWHPGMTLRHMAEMMADDWNDPATGIYDYR